MISETHLVRASSSAKRPSLFLGASCLLLVVSSVVMFWEEEGGAASNIDPVER